MTMTLPVLIEIAEMELWFNDRVLKPEYDLDRITHVKDSKKFIQGHFDVLRSNPGKSTFLPYWNRLNVLKSIIEAEAG